MEAKTLTAKGTRQADAVLDAAIRCLGRDGYAGASLQRIADEAGVQKRMVLYYFGSREGLMSAALRRLADGLIAGLEARVATLETPAEVVDAVFDTVAAQLEDRRLLAAYFGLVAESATDPVLREALDDLREQIRVLAHRVLDRLEARGHQPAMERELMIAAAGVAAQGLGLELMQHGTTPEVARGLALARAAAPMLLFE